MNEVSVIDMANARERRAAKQYEYIEEFSSPLVSFMLNIPGPVKSSPLFDKAFDEGCRRILEALKNARTEILKTETFRLFTGNEFYAAIKGDGFEIKKALLPAEESDSLGRLFDIDVILPGGKKVSRSDVGSPERKCLLCGNDAHACSRNRTHTVGELVLKINSIIEQWQET